MKKKLILLITAIFVYLFFVSYSFAQNLPSITPYPTPTPVDYQLPYPGLLPDNILYKLKTLRDKVVSFFISEPLKKADFDILQADKRYNAGLFLFQEGSTKDSLIIDTISKADNYMDEAFFQASLAKKQGEDNRDILNKMSLSNQKHREVLLQMEQSSSGLLRQSLINEEKRVVHMISYDLLIST